MLAVEAHHLRATIGSLEKRSSSLSCGIQHVLKMISSGESEDLSTKVGDNFWDFFSGKPTDQANTSMDSWIAKLSESTSIAVETNDDISSTLAQLDTGDIFNLDTDFGLVLKLPSLPGEGSHAMLIKDGEEDTPILASSLVKTIDFGISKLHEPSGSEHLCAPFSRVAKRQNSKGWFPCLAGCTMGFNLVSSRG